MRWYVLVFVTLFFIFPNRSQADSSLNVGLFLDAPDLTAEDSSKSFNLTATSDDESYNMGLSVRAGAFVFGFESRQHDIFGDVSGAALDGNGPAGFSGNSSVLGDSTYRVLMGMVLPNQSVVYGFNGITSQKARRRMSYNGSEEIVVGVKENYDECGRYVGSENISKAVFSYGEDQDIFTNLGLVLGAGFEQVLFGGALRFEYSMTHFGASAQSLTVNRKYEDKDYGFASKEVKWEEVFEHSVEMRWQTSF